MKPAPVAVGDMVAEKYRVDGILGRGGMGVVVSATDLELDRKVAIKFVERNDEQATARFLREARAAANLDSQHITRVYECGRLEQGLPFIVMEQLHGDSFATLVQKGPFPIQEAASYMMQVCDALAQAHAKRLVHRDLKPDNLFLHTRSDGGRIVKVLDFGVSKALGGTVLTESRAIVGSPPYLAPEQIEHPDRVDPRTDIWALGVVLYELISGERPFQGTTMVELCMNILSTEPPPLRSKVHDLPVGLEQIASRCLSKPMDARFQNVADLAQALQPFSDSESGLLASAIKRALEHESAMHGSTSTSHIRRHEPSRATRKQRLWATAASLVALAGLAFVGSRVLLRTNAATPAASMPRAAELSPPRPATRVPEPTAPQSPTPARPAAASGVTPEPSSSGSKLADGQAAGAPPTATADVANSRTAHGPAARPRPSASTARLARVSQAQAATGPKTPSCRVIELVENGRTVQASESQRVTFEWARRLCTNNPRAGAYRLSEAGIVVKCACD